jgi:predicted AlkP superfamily pyrophosphatase or phosphodiesterase
MRETGRSCCCSCSRPASRCLGRRPRPQRAADGPGRSAMARRRPAPGPRPIADHVIILSEDGLRPDALAQAKAPMHQELMREGAYTMRARTIRFARPSLRTPRCCRASTSDSTDSAGTRGSRSAGSSKVPTVFSGDRPTPAGQRGLRGASASSSTSCSRLGHHLRQPGYLCHKVVPPRPPPTSARSAPAIEFVHFSDPDSSGHSVGWMSEDQLTAVAAPTTAWPP